MTDSALKICISLPRKQLELLDRLAEREQRTRSNTLAWLVSSAARDLDHTAPPRFDPPVTVRARPVRSDSVRADGVATTSRRSR